MRSDEITAEGTAWNDETIAIGMARSDETTLLKKRWGATKKLP